jgi:hypothetical protein
LTNEPRRFYRLQYETLAALAKAYAGGAAVIFITAAPLLLRGSIRAVDYENA